MRAVTAVVAMGEKAGSTKYVLKWITETKLTDVMLVVDCGSTVLEISVRSHIPDHVCAHIPA